MICASYQLLSQKVGKNHSQGILNVSYDTAGKVHDVIQ